MGTKEEMFPSKMMSATNHPYMIGKGGRRQNNLRMQGLTLKSLKHHIALQPLFIIMSAGMALVVAVSFRSATRVFDVNLSKIKDPVAPMTAYTNKRYQLLDSKMGEYDYSTMSDKRGEPNYRD